MQRTHDFAGDAVAHRVSYTPCASAQSSGDRRRRTSDWSMPEATEALRNASGSVNGSCPMALAAVCLGCLMHRRMFRALAIWLDGSSKQARSEARGCMKSEEAAVVHVRTRSQGARGLTQCPIRTSLAYLIRSSRRMHGVSRCISSDLPRFWTLPELTNSSRFPHSK
jgi:hypothetical protein